MVVNYTTPWPFWRNKRSLADDLRFLRESPSSSSGFGSANSAKHVVIVMDGLEDFTLEPLEWALENIAPAGCTVTLLGLMPWLNIPCKYQYLQLHMLVLQVKIAMPLLKGIFFTITRRNWLRTSSSFLFRERVVGPCKRHSNAHVRL